MKLGRTFTAVRDALARRRPPTRRCYVERATTDRRAHGRARRRRPGVGALLLARAAARARWPRRARRPEPPRPGGRAGEVAVVGPGPAGRGLAHPGGAAALAAADDLVGYAPYLDRVPPNPRQRRHAERQPGRGRARRVRARPRRRGPPGRRRVRPATRACSRWPPRCSRWPREPQYADVAGPRAARRDRRAARWPPRVGAPLGPRLRVISLSDRLKPWDVVAARLAAAARADLAIAIYNPASQAAAVAGRGGPRPAAGAPRPGHPGRRRPRRRRRRASGSRVTTSPTSIPSRSTCARC